MMTTNISLAGTMGVGEPGGGPLCQRAIPFRNLLVEQEGAMPKA